MSRHPNLSKHRRHVKRPAKPWFAIIVSFIFGYLTAFVCDLQKLTHLLDPHTEQRVETASKDTPTHKPTFEFYTLLSKENNTSAALPHATTTTLLRTHQTPSTDMVVTKQPTLAQLPPPMMPSTLPKITLASAKPTTAPKIEPTKSNTGRDRYFVQMASFNRRNDAEHLKATLVLRGFDVGISTIQKSNQTWFRVTMGPFASRIQAEHAQRTIEKGEHIRGILYKLIA